MATTQLKVLELRRRLLIERISLQRGELAAHLRGVKRGASILSLGFGAMRAARGAAGALAVAKLLAPGGKRRRLLPLLATAATAAFGLGKGAIGLVRRRMAKRDALDVPTVK